jgi:hypothetical protein
LSFDEFYFTIPGLNEYLNAKFHELLSEEAKATFDIMPVTLINLDILFHLSIRKLNFRKLEELIIRYWNIIQGRSLKYKKTGATADMLLRLASFDEVFHTIMVGSVNGYLPKDPMTSLLELGNISQASIDEKV